jgi:hypothetical protein
MDHFARLRNSTAITLSKAARPRPDWVKNGDRWTITGIGRSGDLTVRHNRSQLIVRLPIEYVRTSTDLGYASTIHAAQGVSADTMHGLLTGRESRQQLYTMLSRGRHANHLYLQVVGDGDPHTLIRPDTIAPRTPTETLQQILARDEAPVSASSLLRELNDPAARLFQAVQCYTDGLHVAAEQLLGPPDRRRARPSRPLHSWTHRRTRLADPASPSARPRRRNQTASTPPPADRRQRTRPPNRRRHGRRPLLAPPRAHPYQPRSAALAPRHSTNAPCRSRLGPYLAKRSELVADLANSSNTTSAKVTSRQPGLHR